MIPTSHFRWFPARTNTLPSETAPRALRCLAPKDNLSCFNVTEFELWQWWHPEGEMSLSGEWRKVDFRLEDFSPPKI